MRVRLVPLPLGSSVMKVGEIIQCHSPALLHSNQPNSTTPQRHRIDPWCHKTGCSSGGCTAKIRTSRSVRPSTTPAGMEARMLFESKNGSVCQHTSTSTRLALLSCSARNDGSEGASFNRASSPRSRSTSLAFAEELGGSPFPISSSECLHIRKYIVTYSYYIALSPEGETVPSFVLFS